MNIKMPVLKKACCCCQLATGGVILGWLGAVIYFFSLIYGILVAIHMEFIFRYHFDTTEDELFYGPILEVILTLYLALATIDMIAAICLMIGAMKRNRFLILPWLVGEMITIIIYGIAFFVLLIQLCMSHIYYSFELVSTIMVFVFFLFQTYYWVCAYSLYDEIREEEKGTRQENVVIAKRQATTHTTNDELPPYNALV